MENRSGSLKSFPEWAIDANERHPEIIKRLEKSVDPFERALAKTILEAAGCGASVN